MDVRAENLGDIIEPRVPPQDETAVAQKISQRPLKDSTLVHVCDPTGSSLRVLGMLLDTRRSDSVGIEIVASEKHYGAVKKVCDGKGVHSSVLHEASYHYGEIEGAEVLLPKEFGQHENWILISRVGLDPLFGFTGGPVSLTRTFGYLMSLAYGRRVNDEPAAGDDTELGELASLLSGVLGKFVSFEILGYKTGIVDVFTGNLEEAHDRARRELLELCKSEAGQLAGGILSSPGGEDEDRTLASSLDSLWNVYRGVGDGGAVGLVAECSDGLGSEAMRLAVSGRLDLKGLSRRREYVEGLETLLFLKHVQTKRKITLVSTLPQYYLESILGIRTGNRAGDALNYVLNSVGARTKLHVLPYGSQTLLRTAGE